MILEGWKVMILLPKWQSQQKPKGYLRVKRLDGNG